MSFDLTNKNIQDTFQNLLQKTGSEGKLFDLVGNEITDLTIGGTLTAHSYITSESIVNTSSGSTAFGNSSDDSHLFTGDIKLEVIAEDTLIEPWQSDFVVETAKKVTVEVKSQKQKKQIKELKKPRVKVKSVKNEKNSTNEMVNILIKNNITINKVLQNKKKIAPILKNYADTINYQGGTQKFIKEVINKLAKT